MSADGTDVEDAVTEYRRDSHRVRVVAVVDRDEVGERVVVQRAGQLIEIYLHAHDVRIRRTYDGLMAAGRIRLAILVVALATIAVFGRVADAHRHEDSHEHNAADVAFAQNMIPHHQQAVDMAAMVPAQSTNSDLIVLARHILEDQRAEINTMTGWLAQWGEPVGANGDAHGGHEHMAITGMVDDETMRRLPTLSGEEFDALWIKSMIGHHQGAIDMAETEIAQGQNPDAVKMAGFIVTAQQREISQLNHLVTVSE